MCIPNSGSATTCASPVMTGTSAGSPGDVERLGAGEGWLEGARQLDRDLERVRQGLVDEPVTLRREAALALYQILRITHMGRPSRLTDLWDALAPQFRTSERGDT